MKIVISFSPNPHGVLLKSKLKLNVCVGNLTYCVLKQLKPFVLIEICRTEMQHTGCGSPLFF